MQTTILTNCDEFKCNNNKSGQCLLAKVSMHRSDTPIVGKLTCNEAEYKPETKNGHKTNSRAVASS